MADSSFKIKKSLNLEAQASPSIDTEGDLAYNSTTHTVQLQDNSTTRNVLTDTGAATITNKSIDSSTNTITNLINATISATAAIARSKVAAGSANHVVIDASDGTLTTEATLAKTRGGMAQDNTNITFPASGTMPALTPNNHGLVVSGSAATATVLAPNASTVFPLISGGTGADPSWAKLSEAGGGTNQTTYAQGDILYASATDTLSKLAKGTSGKPLVIGATVPSWTTLGETGGGTNQATYTTGDILYASATNTLSKLPIGSANQAIKSVGGIPAWGQVASGINYLSTNPDAEGNVTTGWALYNDKPSTVSFTSSSSSADTITAGGAHGLNVGDLVYLTVNGVGGLATNTRYYVQAVPSTSAISLATARGGSAVDITGATTVCTLQPAQIVNGTAGSSSASSPTWTTTSTTPERGTYSFLYSKPAVVGSAGEGVSYDFTIDRADRGKVIQCSWDMEIMSGTFNDDDLEIWIYDKDNSVLIQPTPFLVKSTAASVTQSYKTTFQTAIGTGGASQFQYRLIIHNTNTSATAYTVNFDNFMVGPPATQLGSAITDWTAWTPTGAWSANTTYTAYKRRVGDYGEYVVKVATAGAPTTATLTVNMPGGEVIDTTKLPSTLADQIIGECTVNDSATTFYDGMVVYSSTTAVAPKYCDDAAAGVSVLAITQAAPITFGASDAVVLKWRVPIVGWSSGQVMSSDTDTRIVKAKYYGAATTIQTTDTILNFGNLVKDTHGAVTTGASWKFTAPLPGEYEINGFLLTSDTASMSAGNRIQVTIYKNGATDHEAGHKLYDAALTAAANLPFNGSITLVAGDYIDIRAKSSQALTLSATVDAWVSIKRLSGPAQIAASESVYAQAYLASSTAFNTAVIVNDTKTLDTHSAYSTTTGTFTCPMAGTYQVSVRAGFSSGSTSDLILRKNSSAYSRIAQLAATVVGLESGTGLIRCVAGDTLNVATNASITLAGAASGVHLTAIEFLRIGN